MEKGIFITAVDTGIGKTIASAGLLNLMKFDKRVAYWKPIQTGTVYGNDLHIIQEVTQLPPQSILPPVFQSPESVCPYLAASRAGKTISVGPMVEQYKRYATDFDCIVVEGAGGLMIPYNKTEFQIDFMKRLGLPVVLVAEDRLGAINQTLLSINELKRYEQKILGVILMKSQGHLGNAELIAELGKVPILAEIKSIESQGASQDCGALVAQIECSPELRKYFKLPRIPI